MEEVVKVLIFAVVLAVAVFGIVVLLKEKGGGLLDSVWRSMRFG